MNKKIFFVGTGNMGGAILRGLLSAGTAASEISFLEPNDKAAEAYTALGCVRKASFADGVAAADVTFLCVKPQIFKLVAKEWESAMQSQKSEKTFISIMAGVKRESLLAVLGSKSQVLRVMPNLPLTVGKGTVALATDGVTEDTLKTAEEIFNTIGVTCRVTESWPHPRRSAEAHPRHHRRRRRTGQTIRQEPQRPMRHGLLSGRHHHRRHRCPRRWSLPQHPHQGRRSRHQEK